MITEKLKPFYYLNREQLVCTRILPSKWWMEELLSGRLIPWLFDIDERYLFKVDKKFRAETPGEPFNIIRDLDWELLCRQLGQNDLFEPGGILHGEKELENRWRIWRLLDRAVFVPNLPDGPRS
ncbi:hypothetical protein GL218_06205 [Daldinia childiae]|uniref:uncharacterized protein n=1 Tax=Daldinia childiae TaxID=326645 RepID=UPI0014470D59|nr:uncharacterized protein GL218_06205 [Daldinia childiae]KAF3057131.1 hypothetical protein GL218_06205 [Daldinia childiae]